MKCSVHCCKIGLMNDNYDVIWSEFVSAVMAVKKWLYYHEQGFRVNPTDL